MESSAHSALTNAKDDEIDELKKEINDLKAYKGNESALLISKDEIINTLKENTINLLKAKNDQISDLRALLNEKDQQLTKYKNEGEDLSDSEIYIDGTRRIQVAGNPSFTAPFIRAVSDWTVILRRVYGNVSFSRDWNEYKNGFGDPNGGDFHIGLDNLYSMLRTRQHELYVSVKDVIGSTGYARYDNFKINHENASYNLLSVGEYKGTAGDSLSFHVGLNFTAKGRDPVYRSPNNDLGGWWFKTTKENERAWLSNLNGKYYESGIAPNKRGITWGSFSDFNYSISLTFAQMMIRPRP
ncbi:uncharacterized protein Dwil_GK27183 [Drosophila willistoni]|uniref:Fibrinogen C-terminal domain-containing protein n=2 Tax=Drosophila willistoni TaxID=7260 RepID=A0A0Q9WQF8_DROWI|nr:uncharacterized protein Dwil_GK27183 [Drosophila willistoni]